jgi:tetratricopeptide (TPR) repeat protein
MKRPILFLIAVVASLLFCENEKFTAVHAAGTEKSAGDEAADLQKKLRKKPNDFRLRVRLGMAFLQAASYDAALAQFDSALALQPDLAAAKFGRAEGSFCKPRRRHARSLEVLGFPKPTIYEYHCGRIGAPYAIRQLTASPGEI